MELLSPENEETSTPIPNPTIFDDNSEDDKTYHPNAVSETSDEDLNNKVEVKRARWRKTNLKMWKRNQAQLKRNQCLPYKTKKGLQAAKYPKSVNCDSCRFNCTKNFTEEDRYALCKEYWQLEYSRKKDFIMSNVVQDVPIRRKCNPESGSSRNTSRKYYFKRDDFYERVCQNFFIKTLCISDGPIIHAFKNVNGAGVFSKSDQRGKSPSANKTEDSAISRVRSHIEKFPVIESHYCRKSSKRQYLDPKLSISKMHDLYVSQCKKENTSPVSMITYRRIFCNHYNLSFYRPKKDQCVTCNQFLKASDKDKISMQENYDKHKSRELNANSAKASDKKRSETDSKFLSATFDLQSVLQMPSDDTSQMYYSRKICVYNLTIYESRSPKDAYCLAWSELNGKRGSCEVGSALLFWLKQNPESISEISLFSNSCGGQNRNQNIAALFLYVVQKMHFNIIEHKFLESGHSYMEADSVHSAIEAEKKNRPVYSMIDWLNIFRMARSSRKRSDARPYVVKELKFNDMIDLRDLSKRMIKNRNKDSDGNNVSWLQIRALRFEKKNPGIIMFKYDHVGPYKKILVRGRGRQTALPIAIKTLYNGMLPLTKVKKDDLMRLCSTNIIPSELHAWYASLPTTDEAASEQKVDSNEESEDDCI